MRVRCKNSWENLKSLLLCIMFSDWIWRRPACGRYAQKQHLPRTVTPQWMWTHRPGIGPNCVRYVSTASVRKHNKLMALLQPKRVQLSNSLLSPSFFELLEWFINNWKSSPLVWLLTQKSPDLGIQWVQEKYSHSIMSCWITTRSLPQGWALLSNQTKTRNGPAEED